MGGIIGFAGAIGGVEFFEYPAKPGKCGEMLGIEVQRLLQIIQCQPQTARHEPRHRARMIGFGKIGRMVYHGAEMLYRPHRIAPAHGILAPLQQQICTGRPRARPQALYLPLYALPALLIGGAQLSQQLRNLIISADILRSGGGKSQYCGKNRNQRIEKGALNFHKP